MNPSEINLDTPSGLYESQNSLRKSIVTSVIPLIAIFDTTFDVPYIQPIYYTSLEEPSRPSIVMSKSPSDTSFGNPTGKFLEFPSELSTVNPPETLAST